MVRLRMKRVLFMPYCLVQTQSDISFHIGLFEICGWIGWNIIFDRERIFEN